MTILSMWYVKQILPYSVVATVALVTVYVTYLTEVTKQSQLMLQEEKLLVIVKVFLKYRNTQQ